MTARRIEAAFARAKGEKRSALVAYLCAGDPSLAATERLVPAIVSAGADIIELGVPFSDPIADGPVIQAASQRALASGTSLPKLLDLVARLRASGLSAPLVLMGYANPMVAMGWEQFAQRAARAGVDGAIVPDLPLEEAEPVSALFDAAGLDLVLLAAPTTPPERLARIAERTRGFLYFVSVTGVTGGGAELPEELPAMLARAASVTGAGGGGVRRLPARAGAPARPSRGWRGRRHGDRTGDRAGGRSGRAGGSAGAVAQAGALT
jgi:tryptophan synthase alpha chain